MTSILALDLGTTTGFAWSGTKGVIVSGTWNLRPAKYEGGGMRFLRFRGKLNLMHDAAPIGQVVFEAVRRHIGTDAAHVYGGLMGELSSWCEERKIPYEGVAVGTIKKFWTGNGAAKKDRMIEEARLRGFEPADDNEADALAILHWKLAGT